MTEQNLTNNKLPESYYGFIYHYYRAEVYRETIWRNRLDVTTNWSIVVTAAMLSYTFSNETASHIVILLNLLIVLFFIYIESRRFRYYSLLRQRTRLIEKGLLTQVFMGKRELADSDKWREKIANSLEKLKVPLSRLESIAWRVRRNYFVLLPLLFLAWLVKVQTYPFPADNPDQFFTNASIGWFPGIIIFSVFLLSVLILELLAFSLPQRFQEGDLP